MAQVARAHTEAAGGPGAAEARCRSSSAAWARSGRRSSSRAPSARSRTASRSSSRRPSRRAPDHPQRRARSSVAEGAGAEPSRDTAAGRPTILLRAVRSAGTRAAAWSSRSTSRPARPWARRRWPPAWNGARRRSATSSRASRSWVCSPIPHTSAGRVPTEAGYRYFVDRLLPDDDAGPPLSLSLVRREIDEAMRVTTETLSQVTNLLAIVTAPPIETSTIRHIEVLSLQPQVLMVVVITSTGGVTKRLFTFARPVDAGSRRLGGELPERAPRRPRARRPDPPSAAARPVAQSPPSRTFLDALAPVFTELEDRRAGRRSTSTAPSRLLRGERFGDVSELNALMDMLERRVTLLGVLRTALDRARRARPDRRRERACRRCARSRSSPPATACRNAGSERSR